MSEWQPNPQELHQLLNLLQQSMESSSKIQLEILNKLEEYSNIPDYNSYLAFIFAKYTGPIPELRIQAGTILKNNVHRHFTKFSAQTQTHIKNLSLQLIGDENKAIRRIAAAILRTMVEAMSLENSKEFLQFIIYALKENSPNVIDGGFQLLIEISEDFRSEILERHQDFVDNLVPILVNFMVHPNQDFRAHSVYSLTIFVSYYTEIITPHFQQFLANAIFISNDNNSIPEVRKNLCSLFIAVMSVNDRGNFVQEIFNIMLKYLKDPLPYVSTEACEFWVYILEQRDSWRFCEIITPFLKELLEVLLRNLIFSEEERSSMEQEERQNNLAIDRKQDVKPRSYQKSSDHEDDDDDDDEDSPSQWNLRKCSACALDYLSVVFKDQMLQQFLPILKSLMSMNNPPWYIIESITLALGAIVEGCFTSMIPYLPQLVPFMINNLSHSSIFVRKITCWTISRYASWIVKQPHQTYFHPILERLLNLILDQSKLVQYASLLSLTIIIERTSIDMFPYLQPVFSTWQKAFHVYQFRNLLLLYDTVGTLCETHPLKTKNEYASMFCQMILPSLMERFQTTDIDDKAICALCACFTFIAISLGPYFQPFSSQVFTRCLEIIKYHQSQSEEQLEYGSVDNDFIICPLDLISGMTEGMGKGIESLLSQSNFLSNVFEFTHSRYYEIRQVAYRLIGDISKASIQLLEAGLIPLSKLIIAEDPKSFALYRASEAAGNLVMFGKEKLLPIAPMILDWFIRIINDVQLKKSSHDVTAVSLGRFCYVFPDVAAPKLGDFAQNWCISLVSIRRFKKDEKEIVYAGLCSVVSRNASSVFNNNLIFILHAIAHYNTPPPELSNCFQQIIDNFKRQSGEHWSSLLLEIKDSVDILNERYRIKDPVQ